MVMKNNKKEINVKEYSFAKYITKLRMKRNLTQKALAEKIQVSDRTISKWENGLTVPDLHNIRIICQELGVSANSLVLEKHTMKDYFNNILRFLSKFKKHIFNNFIKILFIIVFLLLLVYFINNYNSLNVFVLNYDSDEIKIGSGFFVKSKVKNILIIDNIELVNVDIEDYVLNLKLYILVNGDEVTIYDSNTLDDIILEELTGYPDVLEPDVIKALTQNMYLTITIYDNDDNEYVYNALISFKEDFSNNKFIYSNYNVNYDYNLDYKLFLDSGNETETQKSYKNLNVVATYQTYQANVFHIENDSEENEIDNNKLKDLGYEYDGVDDIYIKNLEDKQIIFSDNMNLLIVKKNYSDIEENLYYYIKKDRIYFESYNDDNEIIDKFKLFIIQNEMKCKVGNCKKYQNEIDYILAEYQEISVIL